MIRWSPPRLTGTQPEEKILLKIFGKYLHRRQVSGSKPGAGPVGGGRVHRDPHHAGVQLGRLLQAGDGKPHEGGDTSRPGQVVLVGRQVEISGVKQSAKSGVFTLYLETAEDEKLLRDAFAASQNTLEK